MMQMCQHCRRANPPEALYCYHDGNPLGHPVGAAVPAKGNALNIAARPFSVPFVFPSGIACHNFLELSLACQEDSAAALHSLRKGLFGDFLTGQGRADLALAAASAANAVDRERGLDEFLSRLPVPLKPAKLRVECPVVDLGMVPIGEDRRFELVLLNNGKRLLNGSAHCTAPWLSLGEGPAVKSRVFRFLSKNVMTVRVIGSRLYAFDKPQETQIVLESNGGTIAVTVRISVPVQPFPEGVLSGVLSPRQLAHKAKEATKEAAALIESGAVARWYEGNGWAYPVLGPSATGIAAVQQLFEALGLVRAPRVELSEDAIRLHGRPGEKLEYNLAVVTQENRAAIAHGTSDQPWLEVGRPIFRGRCAFLPLTVAAVPSYWGDSLKALITVMANGGQCFSVPVTLVLAGAPAPSLPPIVVGQQKKDLPWALPAPALPRPPAPIIPPARVVDAFQIVRGLLILFCLLAFGALAVLGWLLWQG